MPEISLKIIMSSLMLLMLSSCQNGVSENIRKLTYPPDFNYISEDKLSNTMQTFAWYTSLLDNYLQDSTNVTNEQRDNAIQLLKKMERLSLQLGTESLSSNHNILSYNIDNFRLSIIEARKGLEQEPANFYRAGTLSGYCINCHSLHNR